MFLFLFYNRKFINGLTQLKCHCCHGIFHDILCDNKFGCLAHGAVACSSHSSISTSWQKIQVYTVIILTSKKLGSTLYRNRQLFDKLKFLKTLKLCYFFKQKKLVTFIVHSLFLIGWYCVKNKMQNRLMKLR
jgi:hypothetical protein